MIGYQVGSQVDDPVINWWMVISGWVLLGTGLVGYFSLFTVVLIRRQLQKNKTETLEK
jgi:hypothetical protein